MTSDRAFSLEAAAAVGGMFQPPWCNGKFQDAAWISNFGVDVAPNSADGAMAKENQRICLNPLYPFLNARAVATFSVCGYFYSRNETGSWVILHLKLDAY